MSSTSLLQTQWVLTGAYFDKFPKGDQPHSNVREQFLLLGRNSSRIQPVIQSTVSSEHERRQIGVLQLIAAYRNRGHQKQNWIH